MPAWMNNNTYYRVWDETTYPFPNFSGRTVDIWKLTSNPFSHFTGHVITFPCWYLSYTMLVKGAQDNIGLFKLQPMLTAMSTLMLLPCSLFNR